MGSTVVDKSKNICYICCYQFDSTAFSSFPEYNYRFKYTQDTPSGHSQAKEKAMSVFDQRGQQVIYQYNVNGVINFGNVQNGNDLVGELEKLQAEVAKANTAQALPEEKSIDVEANIKKAVLQAQKPTPDKSIVIKYLDEARKLIIDVAAVAGLVKGISQAIETVSKVF